jgi:hypothetical protein
MCYSPQKGDWFQAQDLNFRELQAAVQNDLKTGFRTVRLEFSIIETEIKHTLFVVEMHVFATPVFLCGLWYLSVNRVR